MTALFLEPRCKARKHRYYPNLDNHSVEEQPYAETLIQAENEKVIEKYAKKIGKKKYKVLSLEGHLEKAYASKAYMFV